MAIQFESIFDVESEEVSGKIRSLHRRGRVTGLDPTGPGSYTEQVWSSSAVPSGNIIVRGNYLALRRRKMTVGSNTPRGHAEIDLFYELATGSGTSQPLRKSGRVSARQVRTKVDRSGQLITVSYNGDVQESPINVFLPTAEPTIETMEATDLPDILALQWIGKINSTTWRGKPAGQWMCVDASYEEIAEGTPSTYRFRWSFQLADDSIGWLPIVAYVDPATGKTPTDATIGVDTGLATVPYYYEVDFGAKF